MTDTSVSVLVPTLNERERLGPCLAGLGRQASPLIEIIVVDSGSTDGTVALIEDAAKRDPRVRLERDPPLPSGWIGKPWALQHGLSRASGEWILGMDADTEANEGMVAGVVAAAHAHALDLVSFAPMFAGQTAGERWLQPSLLVTLVYRTGAPQAEPPPHRLLANGQCFLVRRETLLTHGGFAPARASFAEDVWLARHYARAGVRCGFLDGRRLFRVRSYRSASEMWREWGRSLALADATPRTRQWFDLLFLLLVQALPLPLLILSLVVPVPPSIVVINLVLVFIRIAVLVAIASSYERRGIAYFASWLADPAAFVRILLSTLRRPASWRGRVYRILV